MDNSFKSKYPKIVIDERPNSTNSDMTVSLTVEQLYDLMHHTHEGIEGGQVDDLTERMLKLEAATGEYAAQVNGKSYDSTEAALDAAGEVGGVVNVLKSEDDTPQEVVDSVDVAPGADLTLDFTNADADGKKTEMTVQREGTTHKSQGFKVEGNMTVKGGNIKNTGESNVGIHYGVFAVESGGTLNLEGAEVDGGEKEAAITIRDGGGTVNVDAKTSVKGATYGIAKYGKDKATIVVNGTVESTKASSTAVASIGSHADITLTETAKVTSNDGVAVALNSDGSTLVVKEGATVTGGDVAIGVLGGTVSVEGGTIKAVKSVTPGKREWYDGSAMWIQARSLTKVDISGGTFESTNAYGLYVSKTDVADLTLTISGGTFTGKDAALKIPEALTGFITGGTFSSKPEDGWLAEGYTAKEQEGKYVVEATESE